LASLSVPALGQQITGIWKGKVGSIRIDLKLVKEGDSLVGTSYYYLSSVDYCRYSVKGYFDAKTNAVVWWDDALIEKKSSGHRGRESEPILVVANFDCPGNDLMKLDGQSSRPNDRESNQGPVHLLKSTQSQFPDEWDFVLENYLLGANDPQLIDSIARLHLAAQPLRSFSAEARQPRPEPSPSMDTHPQVEPAAPAPAASSPANLSVEQKFVSRAKKLEQVIPLSGDSIAVSFYDNAEIDGDSISLYLNGKQIFQHVMLTDKPYTVSFAVHDLADDNEAVMVAENMGSIPPNTALMIATVAGKRYEAHLYSTENSSALIRFVKEREKERAAN